MSAGGDGSSDNPPCRYMPLRQTQIPKSPRECDGGVILYELSASVFQPGPLRFTDVLKMPDHMKQLQLLRFFLDVMCKSNIDTVYIETLVNDMDFNEVHGGEIKNTLDITGIRFWVPLRKCQLYAIASTVETEVAGGLYEIPGEAPASRHRSKKRRVEPSEEEASLPTYKKRVKDAEELLSLMRLYYGGRDPLKDIDLGSTSDETGAATRTFVDLFSAAFHFSNEMVIERHRSSQTLPIQTDLASYTRENDSGEAVFYPVPALLSTGLMREVPVGSRGGMITHGNNIFDFLLPHMTPSVEDVIAVISRVNSASGIFSDLSRHTLEELVQMAESTNGGTGEWCDPYWYSPVVVADDEKTSPEIGQTYQETAMKRQYYTLASLKEKYTKKMAHAIRVENRGLVGDYHDRAARDIRMLLSNGPVDGVPLVYPDLFSEALRYQKYMTSACEPGSRQRLAQRYYRTKQKSGSAYTPLAYFLIRLVNGAHTNLRLIGQQPQGMLCCWLVHFTNTLNHMGASSMVVIVGASDIGKSHMTKAAVSCMAPTLVRQEDGESELAITVKGSSSDLTVEVQDEMKQMTAGKAGKGNLDAESSVATKLKQTVLQDGVVTWSRTIRFPDGTFGIQRSVIIQRRLVLTCSNNADSIPPAIESRAIIMAMTPTKTHTARERLYDGPVELSGSAAVATTDLPGIDKKRQAWRTVLQCYSSKQIFYSSAESIGVLPAIDTTMFIVFQMMLEVETEERVEPRETGSLIRFAKSVCILDMIRAWEGGVGEACGNDPGAQLAFFAYRSFLTAEHVLAAWTILRSTTDKTAQYRAVMSVIKERLIKYDSGLPVIAGDYYVSICAQRSHVTSTLFKYLPKFGTGLCGKLYDMANSGLTDGCANIKTDQYDGHQRIMFHREWLSGCLTFAERAILVAIDRMSKDNHLCCRLYDDEKVLVFRSVVRNSFARSEDDGTLMKHAELAKYTREQIFTAFNMLCDHRDADGMPYVDLPDEDVFVAKYVDSEDNGAVKSTLHPSKYKKKRAEIMPLVVRPGLFDLARKSVNTAMDDMMAKYILIAGRYDDKKVFSGVNSDPSRGLPYQSIKAAKVGSVTIQNPLYSPVEGNEFDDEDESETFPSIASTVFPSSLRTLTFDGSSKIEQTVAEYMFESNMLPERYRELFFKSHELY